MYSSTSILLSKQVLVDDVNDGTDTARIHGHYCQEDTKPEYPQKIRTLFYLFINYYYFFYIEAQRPRQQFFSHVGTEPTLPRFNQYYGELMCLAQGTQYGAA